MQVSKKSLITVLASTAAICCLSVCRAEQASPLPPGSTTDSSNPNAPKTIQSKNINSFYFFAEQLGAVTSVDSRGGRFVSVQDHEDFPKNLGICYFSLNRNGAKADFKVSCQNAGRETFKTSGSTDKSALGRLQEIIDRFKVAHLNGFYKRNSALGNAFRLSVTYDSGEKITTGAEGGASTAPDQYLPSREFGIFFRKLVEQNGHKIPGGLPPISTLKNFSIQFTNFHAATAFPEGRYRLGYLGYGKERHAYLDYGTDKDSVRNIFTQDITRKEADELKSLIGRNRLINLSGYRLEKPDLGNHTFQWTLEFQNGQSLQAEAVGDESILPSKYWDDNGKSYVSFFQKLMKKYRKQFPLK